MTSIRRDRYHFIYPENHLHTGLISIVQLSSGNLKYIGLDLLHLNEGEVYSENPISQELTLIVLGGSAEFMSGDITFKANGRSDVFSGKAEAFYTTKKFSVKAKSYLRIAICRCLIPEGVSIEPQGISKDSVIREFRGIEGYNRRYVDDIITANFRNCRMLVGETYTYPANWSSYIPHKHDQEVIRGDTLIENQFEEIYFYQFQPQWGFGLQMLYTRDSEGALDIRDCYLVRQNDAVIFPFGYHPFSSPPGINSYYLWILASDKIGRDRPQRLIFNNDPLFTELDITRR